MKIAHLSDLHVVGGYFVPEWGEVVVSALDEMKTDITVVTGDLTSEGHLHEYERARELLGRLPGRVLVVPGNHDSRNEGYVLFEDMFGSRYPFFENDDVVIQGVDSSQPDVDDGHVGRAVYPLISERLKRDERLRILAMHHHLIPIPGTGRVRHIPTDAGDVLKLCVDLDLDFVLSGHKHLPWRWHLQDTHFVTSGTATSCRLKGRSYPSFNVLNVEDELIRVQEINVAAGTAYDAMRCKRDGSLGHELLVRDSARPTLVG
jgi:3',5'-cyclic AMP phosphodiesterase CpdA